MRASLRGFHVSGAERIVDERDIVPTLLELLRRPKEYDSLIITLEKLEEIETIESSLPVSSHEFRTVEEARSFALGKLVETGIPERVAEKGMEILSKGANPKGGNMRGAVLLDVDTGERLEPDRERGVRTVRVDWEDREEVRRRMLEIGLTERSLDALALATKNLRCGVLAELCWSDDPDYLTGYVASKKLGYVRITPLKERGNALGGRIYFLKRKLLKELIDCLERKAFLIKGFSAF